MTQLAPWRRVGLFGLFGVGNLGNDGSLEALLAYLAAAHPEAEITSMCAGPDRVAARYGLATTPLNWYSGEYRTVSGPRAVLAKAFGKAVDLVRVTAWVRRHDIVIVPGMGVLEASVPLRPWSFPFSLLLLSVAGRITRTPVALVSVGAEVIHNRAVRWVLVSAARLARYRSFRDTASREAMRTMGVDVSADRVGPDLVFGLPVPPPADHPVPEGVEPEAVVGVGVMDYYGSNDERRQADVLGRRYREAIAAFVCWLVDNGRAVRLFTGDDVDDVVVGYIQEHVRTERPGLDPRRVEAVRVETITELMAEIRTVGTFVGTRFHNVLCALLVSVPTLSLGYSHKHEALMADMGLGDYSQAARSVDLDLMVKQFEALEEHRDALVEILQMRNREQRLALQEMFAHLPVAGTAPVGG